LTSFERLICERERERERERTLFVLDSLIYLEPVHERFRD